MNNLLTIAAIVLLIFTFVLSVIVFLLISSSARKSLGIIYVIDDPEDGPQLFLEINGCSIDHLRKQKTIRLKVEDKTPHYIQTPI